MLSVDLRYEIENELARADKARREGLEGRARVCARRAAGLVIKAYFHSHPIASTPVSVYDYLQAFRDDPRTSSDARRIASLLLTRVNEEFQLPVEGDLVSDTRRLVQILEKDII
jgi:hypothetical protein